MLTDTQEGRQLINEVAFRLIKEKAPQELPLYVDTRNKYFADPENFSQPSEVEDEPAGAGEIIAVSTFIKIVFPIVTPILAFLVVKVAEQLYNQVTEIAIKKAMKCVISLFSEAEPEPLFTQAQLQVISVTIQEIAETEAKRLGVELVQARNISDAAIAKLALAKKNEKNFDE